MWQSDEAIHTNLERLLEVNLPQKDSQQSENFDVTCCICYSDRLNGQVPSRTCDNPKCGQSFHIYCLYEVNLLSFFFARNLKIDRHQSPVECFDYISDFNFLFFIQLAYQMMVGFIRKLRILEHWSFKCLNIYKNLAV